MWMMVLFDLPVITPEERKAASGFRKSLLDQGFHMSQFSVYYRLISGKEALDGYIKTIQKQLPKKGKVDIIAITDKQYEGIISFSGRIKEKNEPPRGKPHGIWNAELLLDRRLVREEIYYTVWFNTKILKAIRCLNRGKPRGIKPDFRISKIPPSFTFFRLFFGGNCRLIPCITRN
jgi:CRISPR-associated protein Cas2